MPSWGSRFFGLTGALITSSAVELVRATRLLGRSAYRGARHQRFVDSRFQLHLLATGGGYTESDIDSQIAVAGTFRIDPVNFQ